MSLDTTKLQLDKQNNGTSNNVFNAFIRKPILTHSKKKALILSGLIQSFAYSAFLSSTGFSSTGVFTMAEISTSSTAGLISISVATVDVSSLC